MLSLEDLKSIFKSSAVGTLLIYPDAPQFTIAYANEAGLHLLNTTSAALLGKSIHEYASPITSLSRHVTLLRDNLDRLLKLKKASDAATYPILDEHGQVAFIVYCPELMPPQKDNHDGEKNERQQSAFFNHQSTTILESITDAFFAVDHNWMVTYWNKEAENIMQLPREKIIGRNLWEVYPEGVSLKYHKEYHKAMLQKTPVHFKEYHPNSNIWMELSVYPSNEGISIFFKDISQRIEVEKQFKEAKQNYKNLFDLSPLPMVVYDLETLKYLDVNQAAINHYGYSYEEFRRMTLKDIRPTSEIQALEYIIRNEVKSGKIHTKLTTHQKKNGDLIIVETRGNSIDFGDKKARMVAIIDVTKALAAEEAVKRSEQYFKALIQSGSELIAIIDADGHYSYINSNTNPILGINTNSYLGKSPYQFIHNDDIPLVKEQMAMLVTHKRIKISPFRFLTNDNQYRWLEAVITDMRDDPAVGGLVTNSRDVTNTVNYIEAIEAQNILLNEISWMQSHVVRAPLARMMGLLALLNPDGLDPANKEVAKHLRLSANELDRVIKDIIKKSEAVDGDRLIGG